ncbi:MAG: hypothetical protein ABEK17_04975 [Candidatus Aenigmatarchaeota archaeon]
MSDGLPTLGSLLPIIYAFSAFLLWYTIPKVKKFKGLWYSLGFGMFFIYMYFLKKMLEFQSFGLVNDLLLLIGGIFLLLFSILFSKNDELKEQI